MIPTSRPSPMPRCGWRSAQRARSILRANGCAPDMEARPAPAVSSSHADLRFSELRFGSAWMLRGDPRQSPFLETARDWLGLPLPLQSNTSVRAANHCCLWLGPRGWLWLADEPSSTVDTTRRRVGGAGGALFELSSSYVGWLTRGPAIAEVLNRRRGLSINMIRRLHDKLGISAEVLIRPSRTEAV